MSFFIVLMMLFAMAFAFFLQTIIKNIILLIFILAGFIFLFLFILLNSHINQQSFVTYPVIAIVFGISMVGVILAKTLKIIIIKITTCRQHG